ncbi:hypothetical protein [Streptomyces sp. NBC_00443]|uniref:hypothetical protein n=1 Tax=Streptomyces sp. NBC_00443 TaxID=2975743 RepID=UPI003FA7A64C
MPFSRFGCLIGENNAGKSSVFQALNMFLRSGSATPTDFLNPARPVRIQLTFAGINEADLLRLEEGHRARIEPAIHDGRLALARIYAGPGKGVVRLVKKVPKDLRYQRPTLDEVLRPRSPMRSSQSASGSPIRTFMRPCPGRSPARQSGAPGTRSSQLSPMKTSPWAMSRCRQDWTSR